MDNQQNDDDLFILILLFCGVGAGGAFGIWKYFDQFQHWLVTQGILVQNNNVLLTLTNDGIGLDLPRILIASAIVVGLIALIVAYFRHFSEEKKEERKYYKQLRKEQAKANKVTRAKAPIK